MKKLLILVMVLAMASLAGATLRISVNGIENPPDTSITLLPSQHAVLDVTGDGQTPGLLDLWLLVQGPGTTAGGVMLYPGSLSVLRTDVNPSARWDTDKNWLGGLGLGYTNLGGISWMNFADGSATQPPLSGKLVDLIDFHCEGPGDVLITLAQIVDDGENPPYAVVFDTQIIHQVPEPVTVALLGLGGLFLRRRMA